MRRCRRVGRRAGAEDGVGGVLEFEFIEAVEAALFVGDEGEEAGRGDVGGAGGVAVVAAEVDGDVEVADGVVLDLGETGLDAGAVVVVVDGVVVVGWG